MSSVFAQVCWVVVALQLRWLWSTSSGGGLGMMDGSGTRLGVGVVHAGGGQKGWYWRTSGVRTWWCIGWVAVVLILCGEMVVLVRASVGDGVSLVNHMPHFTGWAPICIQRVTLGAGTQDGRLLESSTSAPARDSTTVS